MREVFISYKSNDPVLGNNDETVANDLCRQLEAAGITCWIAPRDIEPGKRYARAIMDALESCKAMVVVFSRFANESEHIANEVDTAFARKIDIIPFDIDGSQPNSEFNYYLRRMQWINASGSYLPRIPELIAALRHKLGKTDDSRANQNIVIDAPTEANTTPITPDILNFNVNGVSFKMIRVEGGTFMMGATPEQGDDAYEKEKPPHEVTLSTYYIGETQVTQELWQTVMGSNPSHFKGDFQCPVENVSWMHCQNFITRLNQMTGRLFRLPTDAEWEFAARGGNKGKGYKYAGSNNLDGVAWYADNSDHKTHPVAQKTPNELGLYDMSGNVEEWCNWDRIDLYNVKTQMDPKGPSSWIHRVRRGGGWPHIARSCRVSYRISIEVLSCGFYSGFRLAL